MPFIVPKVHENSLGGFTADDAVYTKLKNGADV